MGKRDLITKDFALYVVHHFNSMLTWSKEDILGEIDRTIKEAKPEDVTRVVHGRWIDAPTVAFTEECSVCRYLVLWDNGGLHRYNYCPNCGAKMDLEVE